MLIGASEPKGLFYNINKLTLSFLASSAPFIQAKINLVTLANLTAFLNNINVLLIQT